MKKHPGVEFAVDDASGRERVFSHFDEAAGFAVAVAASGREDVKLDVLILSRAGARAYGGDDAVERYEEDPDASVFERFHIRVRSAGRVS